MNWYSFFKAVGKGLGLALTRLEVVGTENVPKEGPFFLIANHQSVLDPITP